MRLFDPGTNWASLQLAEEALCWMLGPQAQALEQMEDALVIQMAAPK
jgi:hypothetical protein